MSLAHCDQERPASLAEAIVAGLNRHARAVTSSGKSTEIQCWQFDLGTTRRLPAIARVEKNWLVLESNLSSHSKVIPVPTLASITRYRRPWDILRHNAGLPAGIKLVTTPGSRLWWMRSEIPIDAAWRQGTLERCIAVVCEGLREVLGEVPGAAAPVTDPVGDVDSRAACLEEVCHQSGWGCIKRPSGELQVELEVSHGLFHATLAAQNDGVRLWVDVLPGAGKNLPNTTRLALGLLLLRSCGIVRMARAAMDDDTEDTLARFEVYFENIPDAGELAHGLAALSTGCEYFAREAEILYQDSGLAEIYIALNGVGAKKRAD